MFKEINQCKPSAPKWLIISASLIVRENEICSESTKLTHNSIF